jgi:hypothetical protein
MSRKPFKTGIYFVGVSFLIFVMAGCAEMQPVCPEIKISFCPAK